jgi:hypothetical protein
MRSSQVEDGSSRGQVIRGQESGGSAAPGESQKFTSESYLSLSNRYASLETSNSAQNEYRLVTNCSKPSSEVVQIEQLLRDYLR